MITSIISSKNDKDFKAYCGLKYFILLRIVPLKLISSYQLQDLPKSLICTIKANLKLKYVFTDEILEEDFPTWDLNFGPQNFVQVLY